MFDDDDVIFSQNYALPHRFYKWDYLLSSVMKTTGFLRKNSKNPFKILPFKQKIFKQIH